MKKELKSGDIIYAIKKIDKYGRSEISVDAFMKVIGKMLIPGEIIRAMALAELLARLAPPGNKDEWYSAGLLESMKRARLPNSGVMPAISVSLLYKARVNRSVVRSIESYDKVRDPRRWTPLMTALIFSMAHINEEGAYLTTKECCDSPHEDKDCDACMYARYIFEKNGEGEKAERIIELLRTELSAAEEKRFGHTGRKEDHYGIQEQRRMEKGSAKATPVAAG